MFERMNEWIHEWYMKERMKEWMNTQSGAKTQ